jgi:chemotaxis protein MotA
LKQLSTVEKEYRMLTVEGILGIQAGDNPRVLSDKLLTFVPPKEREATAENAASPAAAADGAEPDAALAA